MAGGVPSGTVLTRTTRSRMTVDSVGTSRLSAAAITNWAHVRAMTFTLRLTEVSSGRPGSRAKVVIAGDRDVLRDNDTSLFESLQCVAAHP